jgi:uncharacterized protein YbaR (Trm112 family)
MALPRELFGPPDGGPPHGDGDPRGELLLRCTECRGRLIYFPEERFLFCPASRLRYSITEEGIPVMLIEDAERVDETEAEQLVARARELGLPIPG